jgi:heme-degrading monooxygenase HmoA
MAEGRGSAQDADQNTKEAFMIARISTWVGSAEQLEGWKTGVLTRVKPMVESLEGNAGALFLLDQEQGRAYTITLWRDEDAARNSDKAAGGSQARTTGDSGATMRDWSPRCEVVARF